MTTQSGVIYIEPESLNIVRRNSKRFMKRFRAASNKTIKIFMLEFHKEVKKNISYNHYSLYELQKKGNPYSAVKYRGINSGVLGGIYIRRPYIIQTRSGKLIKSLKIKRDRSNGYGMLYFDSSIAPHAPAIIKGSVVIHGRDVIRETGNQPKLQRSLWKTAEKQFGAVMKSYGG